MVGSVEGQSSELRQDVRLLFRLGGRRLDGLQEFDPVDVEIEFASAILAAIRLKVDGLRVPLDRVLAAAANVVESVLDLVRVRRVDFHLVVQFAHSPFGPSLELDTVRALVLQLVDQRDGGVATLVQERVAEAI